MKKKRSTKTDEEKRRLRAIYAKGMLKGKLHAWHASANRLKIDPDYNGILHAGTKKAALDRFMKSIAAYEPKSQGFLHELEIDVRKPLLLRTYGNLRSTASERRSVKAKSAVVPTEATALMHGRLLDIYNKKKLRKRLANRGYDVMPYYNIVEDPGSISYAVIDPTKVKVKRVYDLSGTTTSERVTVKVHKKRRG